MKTFSLVLLVACVNYASVTAQDIYYSDTGYLFTRSCWPKNFTIAFFIPSKMAMSGLTDGKSVADGLAKDKKTGYSFLTMPDTVREFLAGEFTNKPIKIRNESQRYYIRGFFDSSIAKYGDDFFHISMFPAIIRYMTFTSFSNSLSQLPSKDSYEVKSYNYLILDSVYSSSGHILLGARRIQLPLQ